MTLQDVLIESLNYFQGVDGRIKTISEPLFQQYSIISTSKMGSQFHVQLYQDNYDVSFNR